MEEEHDFLEGEPGIVLDLLPDLSNYLFIHSSLDDAGLDPFEFRIFCHLRRRAKDRTAWPGMRSISEVTGISLNKVCLTIKSLQEKGFLVVHKRPNLSNLYLIQAPKERSCGEHPVPVENGGVPDKNGGVPVVVHKGIQGRYSNEGTPPISNRARPGSEKEVIDYCVSLGLTANDGSAIFNSWVANGFRTKSGPLKDWKASVRTWNCSKWFPSQKQQKFSKPTLADGESVDAYGFICDATCLGGPPRRRRDAQGNFVRAGEQR